MGGRYSKQRKANPPPKTGASGSSTASSQGDDTSNTGSAKSFREVKSKRLPNGPVVVLAEGDITLAKAHVLVNVTGADLSLSTGGLSSNLLTKCGQQLQTDVNGHKGAIVGDVVTTKAYNVQGTNAILHAILSPWNQNTSPNILEKVITTCLTEAEKNGSHSSIAFPTVGCGQLNFPSDVSSKTIFTEVNKFTQYNTLQKIVVVVFEANLLQIFQSQFDSIIGSSQPTAQLSTKAPIVTRPIDVTANVGNGVGATAGSAAKSSNRRGHAATTMPTDRGFTRVDGSTGNGGTVSVTKESDTDTNDDVIVDVADVSFDLSRGALSKHVLSVVGSKQEEDATVPSLTSFGEWDELLLGAMGGRQSRLRKGNSPPNTWDSGSSTASSHDGAASNTNSATSFREVKSKRLPTGPIIVLAEGDMTLAKAHVLVNVIGADLNLSTGGLSSNLLIKCGQQLQTDVDDHKGAIIGDVVTTNAYNVPGTNGIFHAILSPWNQNTSPKILEKVITTCLTEAEKNGSHSSIVFPTIGCGQLNFPPDVSSKTIFTEVNKFTQYNTLEKIVVVVFEANHLQIFQSQFDSIIGSSQPTAQLLTKAPIATRPIDVTANVGSGVGATAGSAAKSSNRRGHAATNMPTDRGFTCVDGSTKESDTDTNDDVIVDVADVSFDLSRGARSKHVLGVVGSEQEEDATVPSLTSFREWDELLLGAMGGRQSRLRKGNSPPNTWDSGSSTASSQDGAASNTNSATSFREVKSKRLSTGPIVVLAEGDMTLAKAHALVNVIGTDLNLSTGGLSSNLLTKCGQQLQTDVKGHNGASVGDVVITKSHNVPGTKTILHAILSNWNQNSSPKILEKVLTTCLADAANDGSHSSIAFPTIGCGQLHYPSDVSAKTIFTEVRKFSKYNTLQKILVVVFEASLLPIFQSQFDSIIASSPPPVLPTRALIVTRPIDVTTNVDSSVGATSSASANRGPTNMPIGRGRIRAVPPTNMPIGGGRIGADPSTNMPISRGRIRAVPPTDIPTGIGRFRADPTAGNGCTVSVTTGSITDSNADVIVNVADVSLDLSRGALSKHVLSVVGNELQESISQYKDTASVGNVVETAACGNLPKTMYHAILSTWNANASPGFLRTVINTCLVNANDSGHKSIAFPTLGCGNLKYPPRTVADILFSEIFQFISSKRIYLKNVTVVVYDQQNQTLFDTKCQEYKKRNGTANPPVAVNIETKFPLKGTERLLQNRRGRIPMTDSEYSLPHTWTSSGIIKKNSPYSTKIASVVDQDTVTEINVLVQNSLVPNFIGKGKDAEGISYKTIDVTRVQRVENHKLFYQYMERRQQCLNRQSTNSPIVPLHHMDELDPMLTEPEAQTSVNSVMRNEINEYYVFHGTIPENIDSIATNGWNCSLCKNQGMFGKGIYCAESLTKADQYVDRGNRSGGEKKAILLRILLGSAWISNEPRSSLTRPPCTVTSCDDTDCMHDRHDSVIGYQRWNFREFVVYDPAQCYPEYIISYKRIT